MTIGNIKNTLYKVNTRFNPMQRRNQLALTQSIQDVLCLSIVVFSSLILYVNGLGFYSDDWSFLMLLHTAPDQSFFGLASALYDGDIVIRQRPMQVLQLATLYRLFGLQPLGYHLVNAAVVLITSFLFYATLCELGQRRIVCLTVPIIYALLPNYSSDRFWIAAFQATLSIAFYLLSLVADLRSVRSKSSYGGWWKFLGMTSLCGSVLAYEVTLPLIVILNPALVWYYSKLQQPTVDALTTVRRVAFVIIPNLVVVALIVGYKILVTVRLDPSTDLLAQSTALGLGALKVNYGIYGVGLPYVVWWIVTYSFDWKIAAGAILLGLGVWRYLVNIATHDLRLWPTMRYWISLTGVGFITFGLGYAIFLTTADVSFSSASLDNRIAIAAALGIALSYVGGLGALISLLPSVRFRRQAFSLLVAVFCASCFMITNTLAGFWKTAYERQQAILGDIQERLPVLPAGSTVLLDGICLEHGGAYVFTGKRDVAGALVILYNNPSLQGTAIGNTPRIEAAGISVQTYMHERLFPYNNNLVLYNYGKKTITRLSNVEVAQRYFETSDFDHRQDCPPGFAWGLNTTGRNIEQNNPR